MAVPNERITDPLGQVHDFPNTHTMQEVNTYFGTKKQGIILDANNTQQPNLHSGQPPYRFFMNPALFAKISGLPPPPPPAPNDSSEEGNEEGNEEVYVVGEGHIFHSCSSLIDKLFGNFWCSQPYSPVAGCQEGTAPNYGIPSENHEM
eukprot:TRINITY_DN13113_c0_g2_i2.p1 TRINITY_DN13113_c0_g2~~TRINITY_DN13113_c0_g2_i2.p1  ORF type:complete len:148 (-),score=20.79 TRINITY_DN13113_c0_g2_i2:122-565(-)